MKCSIKYRKMGKHPSIHEQASSMTLGKFDHAGMDGVDVLTECFIQDCGYGIVKATVEDVVVCFNDIIMIHRKVRDLWHNNYAHTMGPQVSTILSKHKSFS